MLNVFIDGSEVLCFLNLHDVRYSVRDSTLKHSRFHRTKFGANLPVCRSVSVVNSYEDLAFFESVNGVGWELLILIKYRLSENVYA